MSGPRRPGLVVSLHDVCPRTRSACETILVNLDRLGIHTRSLLVIPAEPGAELDGPTAAWLRQRAAAGDELVQHGYLHRRLPTEAPLRAGPALVDGVLARGAGEFLGLDEAAAARRLLLGRTRLAGLGIACAGFVAPAWLYSAGAARAVRRAGFRFLTTHLRLRDLARGQDEWAFGISNRPGPLAGDLLGRAVNNLLVYAHAFAGLVRIAIHPADIEYGRPFEHTLRLLQGLLAAGREPTTYLGWLDHQP